ncbi:MAG: N-acetylglucosamine-specific PTS transporter subunit IIBC [Alphaproteobacteria bacterium]|nr:N-acetylglucosamine-specific PTS transporter subunit IIBC [Alphaproteobacteria bacterium]MBU2272470.1 N-acetylglucosamine-specific PTS transporter subunit IIBC [Alphaproteobacteria bacterium]MBU2417167.1 N-acetylglucosamine-specific PTS transporter subunit IIBC [Alphaproteobacteria bacterium]
MKIGLSSLQPLGRALMLPIAVLPVAGLLLRLGQPDLLDIAFVASAGQAVFANLGLLFAIGVAVGFAKDNNGAAGLAGVVCFLIATEGAKALIAVPPEVLAGVRETAAAMTEKAFRDGALARLGVPIGILSGLIAGDFYNRFSTLKLPEYLAFFSGRRFVPIVAGFAGLGLALAVGLSFTGLNQGIDVFSRAIVGSGEAGLFVYGVLNRLMIVTGLHHILNNVAWFIVGDYAGATGDLNRFFAGDPTAGAFMSGFFPVMMFGLPAACLAMYHAARPDRRKAVGGMLASLALTAFLTGVTEPIEFTFMFLAPVLYALHAVLTGVAMVVMSLLDVRLGFTFSAGLFDYVINYGQATRPWLLVPVGLVYGAVYYGLFRFFIARFNLKTPGREDGEAVVEAPAADRGDRAEQFVQALGGAANIKSVSACTTRLRLIVGSRQAIDEPALKRLGARGVISPTPSDLQVVLGPIADAVADEIRACLQAGVARPGVSADALRRALGSTANIGEAAIRAGRLCIRVVRDEAVDMPALHQAAPRGVVKTGTNTYQFIVGADAGRLASDLGCNLIDSI